VCALQWCRISARPRLHRPHGERCTHARLRAWSEEFLRTHATLFAERVRAGKIVDGHGDLHLRNMCKLDGRVLISTASSQPALRAGDVMNDIAFLIMDLDHRALATHANRFLNDYLEQTRDYAGLKLLDFYLFYRACVRAKVMSFESDSAPASERRAVEQEAASYFDLAEQAVAPRAPGLLLTCGVSGSGKTRWRARQRKCWTASWCDRMPCASILPALR